MPFHDSPDRYGRISRALHWGMAALFAWQFAGMALKLLLGRTPLTAFWVGTHPSVGATLLLLIVLRVGWAVAQRPQRPPYQAGRLGRFARLGHLALYALMLVVPALALLRLFGSDRGARLFGVQLRPAGSAKVDWMMAPANLLHSYLAWLLLALIAGHIAMVCVHRWRWRDDVLGRMIGQPADP